MRSSAAIGVILGLFALPVIPVFAGNYVLSSGRYCAEDDLFAAVWYEFHDSAPGAVVADWQDVVRTCEDEIACSTLVDGVIGHEAALVFRDGQAHCPGGQYFVYPSDDPPRRYQRIAYVASDSLWLLCGPIDGPVLVKLAYLDEPTGLVAPDLQLYLAHLRLFAPRRTREIWAHLEFYGFGPNGELLWRLDDYGDRPPNETP